MDVQFAGHRVLIGAVGGRLHVHDFADFKRAAGACRAGIVVDHGGVAGDELMAVDEHAAESRDGISEDVAPALAPDDALLLADEPPRPTP